MRCNLRTRSAEQGEPRRDFSPRSSGGSLRAVSIPLERVAGHGSLIWTIVAAAVFNLSMLDFASFSSLMRFWDALPERICDPLGMKDTASSTGGACPSP